MLHILTNILKAVLNINNSELKVEVDNSNKKLSDLSEAKNQSEIEIKKNIYEYAQRSLDSLFERKRHIEIKSLYVLQASAVLVTLFTALLGIINTKINYNVYMTIFIVLFYILVLIAISCLLVALDDTIASWLRSKKEKEKYKFLNAPQIDDIFNTLKDNYDLNRYYKLMTNAVKDSIRSGDIITKIKVKFFHIGIRVFIGSVLVVIFLGILVA